MVVIDHISSSRLLAARWSTATGILMSASSIRRCLLCSGLHARVPLYKIPIKANHRGLRLQLAHDIFKDPHLSQVESHKQDHSDVPPKQSRLGIFGDRGGQVTCPPHPPHHALNLAFRRCISCKSHMSYGVKLQLTLLYNPLGDDSLPDSKLVLVENGRGVSDFRLTL
ncbi:hypothetical protein TNCV_2027811 [Trichonephila clavipes]|nr:hypothetical protein TNCV_2027811 [Trichonephila clavipes]